MKKSVEKYVLKYALDFGGKANQKVVLGLVLRENPKLKEEVPKVIKEIDKIIKEVEKLSLPEIRKKLEKISPDMLEEKAVKEETVAMIGALKPLPNAKKGKVITRIAPSPSGALHIGHAYGISLNYEYAKLYEGKMILRIEDTNPENIYPKAYELIEDDTRWLTENNVSSVVIQSSRLGLYYDYAEKLINLDKAYVCTCDADKWREMKNSGKACSCRSLGKKDNLLRYARMFSGYAEGEAVLRLKTDIKHKNPAMRDFALMRISEHVHPKTGTEQRVWPLMIFSVAIDDHELGVTHVLNGKDHTDNSAKERLIMEYLGWKVPEYRHWGRINFTGMPLSSSKTRLAIEQQEYTGWDDIKLPFLPALRKRGYQPEAFRKFALEIGLSLNDKTVTKEEFWKMVNSFNKEIVEHKANRYFFIDKPVDIKILGMKRRKVKLKFHPDFPERGERAFDVDDHFYISETDMKQLGEGYLHRLMDCCNFRLERDKLVYVSDDYEEYKSSEDKGRIIHWIPINKGKDCLKIDVLTEDGKIVSGFGEETIRKLNEGDVVQFERRFFARMETAKQDKVKFVYLHK